ncbi:MAG: GNAT family N-acetyltransferase [Clostridia bacterium]|nr:GNAT family N-acetyltransferase [Clostridia bacterium]
MIREIRENELDALLELYLHLHETALPARDAVLADAWAAIMNDKNYHIIVAEEDGRPVASAVCVIVPNLTRNVRPFALIENVVTHRDYRKRGYASACLRFAKALAQRENCYKIMLLTGAKDAGTLAFYQKAGFNCTDKTAFVQWL